MNVISGTKSSRALYTDLIHGIYKFLPLPTVIECFRVQNLWNSSIHNDKFRLKGTLDLKFEVAIKLQSQLQGLTRSRIGRQVTSFNCHNFNSEAVEVLDHVYGNCKALTSLTFSNHDCILPLGLGLIIHRFPNLAILSLDTHLVQSDIIMLENTLPRCHALTSFSFNGACLLVNCEILYKSLSQCLLLERLDLRNNSIFNIISVSDLIPILSQCVRLTTIYLGPILMTDNKILITTIPQCSRLNFIHFTLINLWDKSINYTSRLRNDLLKTFTSVDIDRSQNSYDSYIVTALGRR